MRKGKLEGHLARSRVVPLPFPASVTHTTVSPPDGTMLFKRTYKGNRLESSHNLLHSLNYVVVFFFFFFFSFFLFLMGLLGAFTVARRRSSNSLDDFHYKVSDVRV